MRYELSDFEWIAIKPMLPNKASAAWRRAASSGLDLLSRTAADLRGAQRFTLVPLAEFGPRTLRNASDTTEGSSKKPGSFGIFCALPVFC